jgi:hypothetical protein
MTLLAASRRPAAALLLGATLAALGQLAAGQERVTIPGTSVTLTAPAGFAPARGTRGLENADTGSTITIAERPAEAYADLAARFASAKSLTAGYAGQGVTIRSVRSIGVGDATVPFAVGVQSEDGRTSAKYLALLKGDKTVLVTFTIADRGFSEVDAEALLRSIELTPAPTIEEQLAALPFVFDTVEPFRVVAVRGRDSATLASGAGTPADPSIVIGRGASRALMGDEAKVALDLLKSTGGFANAAISAEGPMHFAGGTGYFIKAVVGERTVVQYFRIVPGGAYLRFLARGETSAMEAADAAIAQLAASVEPR